MVANDAWKKKMAIRVKRFMDEGQPQWIAWANAEAEEFEEMSEEEIRKQYGRKRTP